MSNPSGDSLGRRLNGKLYRVGLLLAAACLVASSFRPIMDNVDLGWHVAQGRWMVEHGAIYRHDALNYPTWGRPLVDEYPLFQVVLYFAWRLGWWGPSMLASAGYLVLIGTWARAGRQFGLEGSCLLLASLATMILYLQLAFPLRPHLISYVSVALMGAFLLRNQSATRWVQFWPVVVLQIVWTNCHSAFVLGPALVGLFGAEMVVRTAWKERRWSWKTLQVWLGAFLLVLLACLVNPFGWARFYPPFYQDQLEAIRAYVSEMEPLTGRSASLYQGITLVAASGVLLTVVGRRGAISWSFLALAALFYFESLSVQKSWPIFGLLVPLLIVSSGALGTFRSQGKWPHWLNAGGNLLLTTALALALYLRLDGVSSSSLQVMWREYHENRRDLSFAAEVWMQAHRIEGRLLHRCEDGGALQEAGYDHGETFGDTGFGKYDPRFIHLIGMLGERPAMLPAYLRTYQPAFVVCNNFCYQWPYYLRQEGWRLIFYSPYSSVWTQAGTRPDLPSVTDEAVRAAFDQDIAAHGLPTNLLLYGRNLLALNSDGQEDFVWAKMKALPLGVHQAAWYWEAAWILCFETPRFSAAHREQWVQEAESMPPALTAEFRASARDAVGDDEGARAILEKLRPEQLDSHESDLLLKIDLAQNRPETLALAKQRGGFDLRDGEHFRYVAEAEMRAGDAAAATRDWQRAISYDPDDASLMAEAGGFAQQTHDGNLQQQVARAADVNP